MIQDFATYIAQNWSRASWAVPALKSSNLSELKDNYHWNGATYLENQKELIELSESLQGALAKGLNPRARTVCIDIFKWGGVLPKNYTGKLSNGNLIARSTLAKKIDKETQAGSLCEWILSSLETAKSGNFERFNALGFVSNSSMTKIHALADPEERFVIYDSRVSAALGFLVKGFLRSKNINSTPDQLKFGYTPPSQSGRIRDPRDQNYDFTRYLRYDLHVKYNVLASQICQQASEQLDGVSSRDIEASLFMLGQDLRQIVEP